MNQDEVIRRLGQCRPFRGLPRSEIHSIVEELHHWIRTYTKGQWLYTRGERIDFLVFLLQGSIRAQMQDSEGKVVRIDTLHGPQMIAPAFVFSSHRRLPIDIIAHSDQVLVLEAPRKVIFRLLHRSPVCLESFLQDIGDKFAFLAEKVMAFSFFTIQQKVAHFLLTEFEKQGPSILLSLTRDEWADLFGVTRPSLSRVLSDMVRMDWIGVSGKTISVRNPDALRSVLNKEI